ncbi:hypothetical protein AHAS_Ahas06G0217300 [Arachis hypogaea]
MGFGALRRIPELNVSHKLLRELILCFDLYHGFLDTHYGKIYIIPAKIGDALGLNLGRDHFPKKVTYNKLNEQQKEIVDSFKAALRNPNTKLMKKLQQGNQSKRQLLICPPEPQHQVCEETLARQSKHEAPLNLSPCPRHWEDDAPSFSLDISSPTSQPTITQLEILVEVVMDIGVTTALQYAEETSAKSSLSTRKGYKTPVKEKEITKELREKYYQWMTQIKVNKEEATNEFETIFMLDHKAHLEGVDATSYL